jgi:hypothetical protein
MMHIQNRSPNIAMIESPNLRPRKSSEIAVQPIPHREAALMLSVLEAERLAVDHGGQSDRQMFNR